MQVRILGPLEASSDGDALRLGGRKQRIVLALLALQPGRVASADELIEAGWGDRLPANPANTLQYQVAQLRKIVEPDPARPRHLITSSPGYRLDPETVSTDAQEFEHSLASAREAFESGSYTRAESLVAAALAWWRGPALLEFRSDEFARGDAERLEAEQIAATELQIDIALATGRHAEATPRLAQLTDEHPLREALWARRMLALYRSGQQSEALRVLQDAREALAAVGLDPGTELRELEQQIIQQDDQLNLESLPLASTPHNLPAPPNRLIGRDVEVEKVRTLLDGSRLVTVLGPGGAGKTRLAIAIGHTLLDRYPGGIWFVPLDDLDDGSLLAAEVGRVTGMRENPHQAVIETLATHLGSKRALLIIDNCEHLIDSVASFAHDLTATCHQLSVLATSQVVLETTGEAVFVLSPLAIPGQTPSIYDPITDIDAVALFLERTRDAGSVIDDSDSASLAAVANIVSALDGMPLALELAAARTRSMSLDEIAQGLNDRFAILSRGPRTAPARQRSLLSAIEWSLNLLEDRQRTLMAKLSVFAGSFDAEDAAAVAGEPLPSVRDDLAALVDRSLLARRSDVSNSARFVMLESLRQHGLIALGSAHLESARNAHLTHFTQFTKEADAGIRGPDQIGWLHGIDAAYANIRAALAWSIDSGSYEIGIQLAAHASRYWDWRGLLKEGSAWSGRLVDLVEGVVPGFPSSLAGNAYIAWEFGELDEAQRLIDRAVAAASELGDPFETAAAQAPQVLISRSSGDLDSARSLGVAMGRTAESAGDSWSVAWAESALATVALAAHDPRAADSHARRSLELFAEIGDRRGESWGLISLAQISLDENDLDEAELRARAALDGASATEDERNILWALEILAEAAHRRGDLERAARMWGAAHPLRESRGLAGSVSKLGQATNLGAVLQQELGDAFETMERSGRAEPRVVIAEELIDRPDTTAIRSRWRPISSPRP